MSDTDQQNRQGLSVAPSPFNAVKLELAIILVAGILLWAVVDSITPSESAQIGILMLFGILGAGWLVLRTRYLSQRISKK